MIVGRRIFGGLILQGSVNVPYAHTSHGENPRGILQNAGFDIRDNDTPNIIKENPMRSSSGSEFESPVLWCRGPSVSGEGVRENTPLDQLFRAPEVIA